MLSLWEMKPDPDKLEMETFCETSAYKLKKRLCKTLYYGEVDEDDITDDEYEDVEDTCPSLPLTDIAVEYFQDVAPRKFGRIDRVLASSVASRACVSPCSVMMSMIYAKRLRHKKSDYLDQVSSSDLFLISMMMASKFIYDEGVEEEVFNDEWAEAADMELDEINDLERQFLKAMDWQLFVKREEFFRVLNQIEQRIALQESIDRGWFTYTDLYVLMRNPQVNGLWSSIGSCWSQVVFISSTAYLAGVLTVIGSTIAALQVSSALTIAGTMLLATHSVPQPGPVLPTNFDSNFTAADYITPLTTFDGPEHENPNTVFQTGPDFDNPDPKKQSAQTDTHVKTLALPKMTPDSLLETLIQKLFTLVTLKGHLVKFVCAVSDNYQNSISQLTSQSRIQTNKSLPAMVQPCSSMEANERLSHPNICSSCQTKQSSSQSRSTEMQGPQYLSTKCLPHCQPYLTSHDVKIPPSMGKHPCCCEEPPGLIPRLVDTSLSFTTRSFLPVAIRA